MKHRQAVERVINYIEDNITKNLSLEILSNQAYISPYHFHRTFKEITNETLNRYIHKRRLTEACYDLLDTNETVTEIAFKYNYGSVEAFSRSFKNYYGKTPIQYRNYGEFSPINSKSTLDLDQYEDQFPDYELDFFEPMTFIGYNIQGIQTNTETMNEDPVEDKYFNFIDILSSSKYPVKTGKLFHFTQNVSYEDDGKGNFKRKFSDFCGVKYNPSIKLPKGIESYHFKGGRYIKFSTSGEAEKISRTIEKIFTSWLPSLKLEVNGNIYLNSYKIGINNELLDNKGYLDYGKLHDYHQKATNRTMYFNSPEHKSDFYVFIK